MQSTNDKCSSVATASESDGSEIDVQTPVLETRAGFGAGKSFRASNVRDHCFPQERSRGYGSWM